MLDDRKLKVLYAIIESYTLNAEPVGSKAILDKYNLGVSSATIRNDMSYLEELGLIEKTHTSSGRIPSDKAYRFYVDSLLEEIDEQRLINESLSKIISDGFSEIEDLIEKSTKLLSEITKQMAVSVVTNDADAVLKRINIVNISKNVILVILIFGTKDIVHETFALDAVLDEDDIDKLNIILNEYTGVSLSNYIEKIEMEYKDYVQYNEFFVKIYEILNNILIQRQKTEIIFEGLSNIFYLPEYRDTEKIKDFIGFVEDSDAIKELIGKGKSKDLYISIGEENSNENLNDITVISSSFGLLGNNGRIGIIGPTRMDYDSVIITILSISSMLKSASRK